MKQYKKTFLVLIASVLSTLVFAQTSVASTNSQPTQKTHCESYKQSAYNCCMSSQNTTTTLKQAPEPQKIKTFAHIPPSNQKQPITRTHSIYKETTPKPETLPKNLRSIVVKNE